MGNFRTHIKALQRQRSAIRKLIKDELRMIEKELPELEDKLNNNALSIISQWYAQRDPWIYRRQMSLKDAFKITVTPDEISVDYSPDYISEYEHNQSAEVIFNNSFIGGYHGGSSGGGDPLPRWRTPVPFFSLWYDYAPVSFSPYKRIEKSSQDMLDAFAQRTISRRKKQIEIIKRYEKVIRG